jgi:hypothetical protein
VTLALFAVITIGTSPAPAREAGKLKFTISKPGISGFDCTSNIWSVEIAVVPTVIVMSVAAASRTPVRLNSITVGTVLPLASVDVTSNGGAKR